MDGVIIKPASLARPDFESWNMEKLVDFALYWVGLHPSEIEVLRTRENLIRRIVKAGPTHW